SRSSTRPTSPCGRAWRMSPYPRSSRRERRGPPLGRRAGAPRARGAAGAPRGALLVSRPPPGTALSDTDAAEISAATLDDLYRELLTLRRARIAHGAISGDAVLVDPVAGTVVLADFRNASERALPDQLDRELAGAIAATGAVA